MIKINNIHFRNDGVELNWVDFCVSSISGKKSGISPRLTFNISDQEGNSNFILIETTYSDFEVLRVGQAIDFTLYISDVIYCENGIWDSLMDGQILSNLIRIDKNKYKIIVNCDYKNLDYVVKMYLEEQFQINL